MNLYTNGLVTGVAAILAVVAPSGAAAQTGMVRGQVISRIEGTPIGYAVISIASLQRELFTGADGRFTFPNLPAGPIGLRARHIGHIPGNVTVTVVAGDVVQIRIELDRLAITLPPVFAAAPCHSPGVPAAADAPELAALVSALRENAERYRLLVRDYPFQSVVRRTYSRRSGNDGRLRELKVDTVLWTPSAYVYKPGTTVQRSITGAPWVLFAELDDFADDAFLENHCFRFAGETEIDGTKLIEVEFRAWEGISAPDMDGSIFLDPKTYQIRRATYALTKVPAELNVGGSVTTETVFDEIVPSIPVMGRVEAETRVRQNATTQRWEGNVEQQELLQVVFLRGKPGGL